MTTLTLALSLIVVLALRARLPGLAHTYGYLGGSGQAMYRRMLEIHPRNANACNAMALADAARSSLPRKRAESPEQASA